MSLQTALIRKVGSVRHKELGKQTGRRSSPIEQTPSPSGTREEVGNKKCYEYTEPQMHLEAPKVSRGCGLWVACQLGLIGMVGL